MESLCSVPRNIKLATLGWRLTLNSSIEAVNLFGLSKGSQGSQTIHNHWGGFFPRHVQSQAKILLPIANEKHMSLLMSERDISFPNSVIL